MPTLPFFYFLPQRIAPLLLGLFLVSLVVCVEAQNKHDGLQWYADAEIARKKGMLPEAIKNYNEALRREPQNYRYLFGKAQVLNKLRKSEDALALLNQAVRIRSNFAPIYGLMASIYEEKKDDPERAAQLYNIAFKNEQDKKVKLDYKLKVVDYHFKRKDYETALRHVKEAKIFALKQPQVHYLDARLSNLLERFTSAEATLMVILPYLKTLHISENARFFYELGYAYYKQGKFEKAFQTWKQAYYGDFKVRIDRYRVPYLFRLSKAYAGFYELEESRFFLSRVSRIQPELPDIYLLQVELLEKEQQQPQYLILLEKALELTKDPVGKARILLQLAELHAQQQDYEACLKTVHEGLGFSKNFPDLYYFEVVSLFHLERQIEARPSLELLIRNTRFSNRKSLYLFLLGMTYKLEGNPRKALELFAQVQEEPYKTAAMEETFLIQNDEDAY